MSSDVVAFSRNNSELNIVLVERMVVLLLAIEVCCSVVEYHLHTTNRTVTLILCGEVSLVVLANPPNAIRVLAVEPGTLKRG